MQEIKRGRTPTPRGLYLFIWGVVYGSLAITFALPITEPTNPLFAIVFGATALVAIASSWWHSLDTIAFSILVGATAFRALWHIFDLSTIPGIRPTMMLMWTAVGISHYIVSKWPYITDRELEAQAKQYKLLYERTAAQKAREKAEKCSYCGRGE